MSHRRRTYRSLVTAVLLLCLLAGGRAHAEQPLLNAVVAVCAPQIDGDLSDECWENAPFVSDFYFSQKGTKAAEPTTAWICYDQKNIYAAFYCKDSQPETIVTQQQKRGGNTGSDDGVWLGIDCYGNGGQSAWFGVTAAGVQKEYLSWAKVSKIEWQGDWNAAGKRVPDGYVVEMAIPFEMLQYHPDQKHMGIVFKRIHPRSTQGWTAPNIGPNGQAKDWYRWEGLNLPRPNTRPKLMAYSLLQSGAGASAMRAGLDVKYSLSPDILSVLTVNPYFGDIEQNVEGVDFTYNERYLEESRPFFQEGEGYFPLSGVLYTRRIKDIDAGIKTYGKVGKHSFAFMNAQKFGEESYTVFQDGYEWPNKANLWLCGVQSNVPGNASLTRLACATYNLRNTTDQMIRLASSFISVDNTTGLGVGNQFAFALSETGRPRALHWGVDYHAIDPDYDPYLGYTPENDLRSWDLSANIYDTPAEGRTSRWGTYLSASFVDHLDGSLFHNTLSVNGYLERRNGTGLNLWLQSTDRPPYSDQLVSVMGWWGTRDLYNNGSCGMAIGRQAGGDYLGYSASQGWSLGGKLSVQASYQHSSIKAPSPRAYSASQLVTTLAYDLDKERTLAGRLVAQRGKTNLYLAYKQRVRLGTDAYIIFGDPNADSTRSSVAIKLNKLL